MTLFKWFVCSLGWRRRGRNWRRWRSWRRRGSSRNSARPGNRSAPPAAHAGRSGRWHLQSCSERGGREEEKESRPRAGTNHKRELVTGNLEVAFPTRMFNLSWHFRDNDMQQDYPAVLLKIEQLKLNIDLPLLLREVKLFIQVRGAP